MHQIVLEGSSKSNITPKTEYIMYFIKNVKIINKINPHNLCQRRGNLINLSTEHICHIRQSFAITPERKDRVTEQYLLVCRGQVPSSFFCSMTMICPEYSPASCRVCSGLFRCSYVFDMYLFHNLTSLSSDISNCFLITFSTSSAENRNPKLNYQEFFLYNNET